MTVDLSNLLCPEGAIARRLGNYEPREEQLRMVGAVDDALSAREQLIVEAGTGVGKSFAYLIPAIGRIINHRERVVISTNTISLQEQLLEKDIPLLASLVPDEFTSVLVKGRGNYLSLRRLQLASERQERLLGNDQDRFSLQQVEAWAYTTRDGTLSTLPQLSRPGVWDLAQSDANNCMGRRCTTYQKCFFQQARRRMENADLLVCNHALFFADMALRRSGGGILPRYDHVIFDEAHNIEDIASEHFGLRSGEGTVRHLLKLLYHAPTGRGFLVSLNSDQDITHLVDQVIDQVMAASDAADALFHDLASWHLEHGGGHGRVTTPDAVDDPLSDCLRELGNMLKLLRDRLDSESDQFELSSYSARAIDLAERTTTLLQQDLPGCVYWIELGRAVGRRKRGLVSLNCAAIDVGPLLQEHLFQSDRSVVLTSATLATGIEDFSHLAGRLGCPDARTLQLGSPFDHARQMTVYVETGLPLPGEPGFSDSAIQRILHHVDQTDGGAFILFTSFGMLDEMGERLTPLLLERDHPVHLHGRSGPRSLLLNRFREQPRSVLLGTSSFWQGVDVRGDALRNVIITRLPFDVPDRPIIQARHERIRESGGNPFMQDQVPRAVIRFKQGIGRLIRSHEDRGRIVLLDHRIVSKPYGRVFQSALPDGVEIVLRNGQGEEQSLLWD